MKVALISVAAIVAFVSTLLANAAIVRCVDSNGKVVFQEQPCPGAKADVLDDALAAFANGDYAQATRLWRPLAEKGNAKAQNYLGGMYHRGWGVAQDYQEAVRWWRLAAAQGNADAQNNLSALYDKARDGQDLLAPSPPVLPASPVIDLYQPGRDPLAPVGEGILDPFASDGNTDTSQRGSYLDRLAKGAAKGVILVAIVLLFFAVRALIKMVKAPGNKDHEMKDNQKLLCIGIIAIIVAMAVYPPFQVHLGGITRSVGYDWIFSPPHGAATIDVAMLIAQWVIVLGIGAIAFILLRKSSQELLSVPPTGPRLPKTASPAMADPDSGPVALGTKWLKFWNYFTLPVGGILCILLVFAFATSKYLFLGLVISYVHFHIAYGLHRRMLEAWKWNWVMVVATWIGGSIPYYFASMLDYAAEFAITFLLFGAIWMWPNYVYWMKRRVLFS